LGDTREKAFKKELVRCMRSLARRSRTEQQIRNSLQDRELDSATIEKIISELAEHSFLDDERFARDYTGAKLRFGFGLMRIRNELRERGVAESLIEKAAQTARESDQETEAFRVAVDKRIRAKGKPDSARELKNLVDYLARRGFTHERVRKELQEYFDRILG
jgi:regulatory protein